MNAIHPTQFFLPSQSVSSSALQATSKDKSYNEAGSCVLAGPSKSGKGALLFNAAVKFALSHTSPVLWLATSETSSKPLPPTSSFTALGSGVPRQALDTALQRIHFKYFDDHGALRLFLVNYCQVPARPGLLIVDDFSMFFPQELKGSERFSYMARTLALLHEATLWHTPSSPPANLIISETLHDNELEPRTLPLLQHWIPLVMLIRIHPPPIPPTPVGHPDAVVRQLWVHQYNQGPDPHKLSYPFTHSPGSGLTSLLPLQHHSSALSSPSQSPLFDSRELRAPVE